MTMGQENVIHHCICNHAYFRNWSCKTMNHVLIATWIREALQKHTKRFSLVTNISLVTADSDCLWLVIEEHLPTILRPVFALWTPLNTLIHPSGRNQTLGTRCKGSLNSWNCNFRTRSKIIVTDAFTVVQKKKQVSHITEGWHAPTQFTHWTEFSANVTAAKLV